MKTFVIIFVLVIAIAAGAFYFVSHKKQNNQAQQPQSIIKENPMQIISSKFGNNQNIPKEYSCEGVNVNPPLEFKNLPQNTQSLALIVEDTDATVGIWTHWLLWNIDLSAGGILENSVPEKAIQGKTSSGQNLYSGPCPPSGTHRYFFKLFALDGKLNLPSYSEKGDLEKAIEGHIIEQAELVGLYSKNLQ